MLQLYLAKVTRSLFLAAYPVNTVDCGLRIANGKWYYFVVIVNLFDIQKV